MHGLKLESDTDGYIYWTALIDEEASVRVERVAQGITGDLLRAYAYSYVAESVRKGGLHVNKAHRIGRAMIQFNRYIVYQADSAHGNQYPDFSYHQYPTSNPHVSIYVFDLVAIQEMFIDTFDTKYARLLNDFRKAGMKPVEKDGVSADVRGRCALCGLVS